VENAPHLRLLVLQPCVHPRKTLRSLACSNTRIHPRAYGHTTRSCTPARAHTLHIQQRMRLHTCARALPCARAASGQRWTEGRREGAGRVCARTRAWPTGRWNEVAGPPTRCKRADEPGATGKARLCLSARLCTRSCHEPEPLPGIPYGGCPFVSRGIRGCLRSPFSETSHARTSSSLCDETTSSRTPSRRSGLPRAARPRQDPCSDARL
jgi:hypothetical protein